MNDELRESLADTLAQVFTDTGTYNIWKQADALLAGPLRSLIEEAVDTHVIEAALRGVEPFARNDICDTINNLRGRMDVAERALATERHDRKAQEAEIARLRDTVAIYKSLIREALDDDARALRALRAEGRA